MDELDAVFIAKEVFDIDLSNIFGLAFIKSANRGPGFNFKLKAAQNIDIDKFVPLILVDLIQ